MKQITKEAKKAFLAGQNWHKDNTEVVNTGQSITLWLFGNCIARKDSEGLFISNGNYNGKNAVGTATTKERLNALPGVSIQQKAGLWILNGHSWNGSWIQIN